MKAILGTTILLGGLCVCATAKTPPTLMPGQPMHPSTTQVVVHPTTQGSVLHPTTSSQVLHPKTQVAVTHPQTTGVVTHPTTQTAVIHPTTTSKVEHPTTQTVVTHPQTTVTVIHPQTSSFATANTTASAGGSPAKGTAAESSSQSLGGGSMSDYRPPQATSFNKPAEKAAPLGGGSMDLGNTNSNQAEKDSAAASSLLGKSNTANLDNVDPKQSNLDKGGIEKILTDRMKVKEKQK